MLLNDELNQIQNIGAVAWQLAEEGEFRAARRQLKRIARSFCVSESEQMTALVEARIFQKQGNQPDAKKRILASIGYLWGTLDAFSIISAGNPHVDENSSEFFIEILGGLATLGAFCQFSAEHVCSFDVVANSLEEALSYIKEVANFGDPTAIQIITSRKQPILTREIDNRGILRAYPFRIGEV